jgi:tellurite resistance protein
MGPVLPMGRTSDRLQADEASRAASTNATLEETAPESAPDMSPRTQPARLLRTSRGPNPAATARLRHVSNGLVFGLQSSACREKGTPNGLIRPRGCDRAARRAMLWQMIELPNARLIALRDELQTRGQRPSMVIPRAAPDVVEAMHLVEEYGAMCEAMFLMMAADKRVRNVERAVLRGALDVLSDGRVRTAHMEAMLDAAAKRLAEDGLERRMSHVVEVLKADPVRAEITLVLAAAVALADGVIAPEEDALYAQFAQGLGLGAERAQEILHDLTQSVA